MLKAEFFFKTLVCAITITLAFSVPSRAQMWNGTDTLYGNEWIDYSKTYFKIKIATDGIYRVSGQVLNNAGFPVAQVQGSQLRLYRMGKEVPIFTSTDGAITQQDYIEFLGEKNRGELDRFLFNNPFDEQINPAYSLFTDSAAYFLTWTDVPGGLRFTNQPNDISNPPAKEKYIWFEKIFENPGAPQKKFEADFLSYSWFNGDGFTTGISTTNTGSFPGVNAFADAPAARFSIRYMAYQFHNHNVEIELNASIDTTLWEDVYNGFAVKEHQFEVASQLLNSAPGFKLKGLAGSTDYLSVAFAKLKYPTLASLENLPIHALYAEASTGNKYFECEALNVGSGAAVVYDVTNNLRLTPVLESNLVKFLLPPSASERKLWVAGASTGVVSVNQVKSVQFRKFESTPADYIIVSAKSLYSDPQDGGANHVEAYANYRSSAAGGGYSTVVADVTELYDQFAYGVDYHPFSIRNFCHFVKNKWPNPQYLLLLGKAVDYTAFRTAPEQQALLDSLFFVPTFGYPGADNLFLTGNTDEAPIFSIGRLAVTNPQEIKHYLDKVIEYEQVGATLPQTIADKLWTKEVIHLSGGAPDEQSLIKNYMATMGNILEQNRFGANISTFYKTSSDPVQLAGFEQILDKINNGAAIMSFFGHSAATTVDFDLGQPEYYHNKGKYPLLMILGCYSGNCATKQKGVGERFVLAKDGGAIGYFASSSFGFSNALNDFGKKFYERIGGPEYGKGIGDVLRGAIGDFPTNDYPALRAFKHQVVLQGDPAVHIYSHKGPDFLPDNPTFTVTPNPVSLDRDSFTMDVKLVNLGENIGGLLPIKIQQKLPSDTVVTLLLDTIPAPAFTRQLHYTFPVPGNEAIGFNRLFLTLDPGNVIAEMPFEAESNNDVLDFSQQKGVDVYFFGNDVMPIFPAPYAIVNKESVVLKASTFNLNAPVQRFLWEFDTTALFNSPAKLITEVVQGGGLLQWAVPYVLQDSTVYYWRIARDSLVDNAYVWHTNSFIYIKNSPPGWNQTHYYQFLEDRFTNLSLGADRKLSFPNTGAYVSVKVGYRYASLRLGVLNNYYEGGDGDYYWNTQNIERGVVVFVTNPNTGRFVVNPPGHPYKVNINSSTKHFWFNTRDSLNRIGLMDFLENEVPDGFIVSILTINSFAFAENLGTARWANDSVSYGKNIFQVLEAQGAKKIRQAALDEYSPYGLIYRKNDSSEPAIDTIVKSLQAAQEIRKNFQVKWPTGFLESTKIGPAKSWTSLHWRTGPKDFPEEYTGLSVYGVRPGLPDTFLMAVNHPIDTSLQQLSATIFPCLRLRYETSDTSDLRSPTPLEMMRVVYEDLPEGAVDPIALTFFHADTLDQGDKLIAKMAFVNVSETAFDSLKVRFLIDGIGANDQEINTIYKPLLPGDTLHAEVTFDTKSIFGAYNFLVDINPNGHQPEQFHFNNVWFRPFYVRKDARNPLLDVTFDGYPIFDGDLVSPKPFIEISLRDENRFLALNDTSLLNLSLVLPSGQLRKIYFSDPAVLFYPASLPGKNIAKIEYKPIFTEDGEYKLHVQGRDVSGNESGDLDYWVNFKVITKSSISNILNYPNPFSTSTCFVYTLTGTEAPAVFKIQIMTISGKIVREIQGAEFGPMVPGTHKSTFCWDGRDEFGDQLANGVYLYRVVAKKADGSDFDLFTNNTVDGYFKNGFGKMMLLR